MIEPVDADLVKRLRDGADAVKRQVDPTARVHGDVLSAIADALELLSSEVLDECLDWHQAAAHTLAEAILPQWKRDVDRILKRP